MRNKTLWLMVLGLGLVFCGCQATDENPNWNPETNYPDWTYDKPIYTEPAVEPKPYETVANDIDVYYSRSDMFFIRHPNGKQPDVRPRTAVWFSYDAGATWQKNGFFGMDQRFYSFFAEQDGRYWIRFVGPNMGAAEVPPGQPHEIHVVDTQAPVITLQVDPPPIEEVCVDSEGNEVPAKPDGSCCCCHRKVRREHIYHVGEKVIVSWCVTDMNLAPKTIELSTCFARFPHNLVWSRFKGKLAPTGTLEVVIPPEAASQAGMRFRMIAHDKADNIGLGMSEVMEVQPALPETPQTPENIPVGEVEIEGDTMETVEPAEEKPMDAKPMKKPVVKPQPKKAEIPEPSVIKQPKHKPVPMDLPAPPTDLTEPVNIESPATKPAAKPKKTSSRGASTKPIPILSLSKTLPATKKANPAPVAKQQTPKPVAVKPAPTKKAEPVKVAAKPKPAPVKAKPARTQTSLADMEREIEKARKAQESAKPAPKKVAAQEEATSDLVAIRKSKPVKTSKPVPVKVLTKAPTEKRKRKPEPAWKPVPPSTKSELATETKPAGMKLGDIPEKTQQGWPAEGMTLHGGGSRLLNWLPESAVNYKTMNLQFSSNNGKTWVTVAKNVKPQRVTTWTVPMVTSKTCLLRVVGKDHEGKIKPLETSAPFRVDAGKWETIDMSGFRMQVPKSK